MNAYSLERSQREFARSLVDIPVELIVQGHAATIVATVRNLSIGGAFIATRTSPRYGAAVSVRIALPGRVEPSLLPATVRWTSSEGFGVQFGMLGLHETCDILELQRDGVPSSKGSLRHVRLPHAEEPTCADIDTDIDPSER